jgi:hypothetical protein
LTGLHASRRASSLIMATFLLPSGGLASTMGMGGVGTHPVISFSQSNRPATSHSLLVQTPHVYTSLSALAVIVQVYDEHGDSQVSQASLTITATLAGVTSLSITGYQMRGPAGKQLTRRYLITVPSDWFSSASVAGSVATVSSMLSGQDSHQASFTVYGTPASFSSRLSSAGIASYFTKDSAGTTSAEVMRAGDSFYLQLYAHTGGLGLTSFEVKIVEDSTVCELVPASGSFTSTYTGAVQGDLSGAYQTELLTRLVSPTGSYFTKYSRFQRLGELTSTHGYLGYIRMKMVGTGSCLTSAAITTFFHSGGTAYIPGVATDDPVTVTGNSLTSYTDVPVGVLGQLHTQSPVINTADYTGVNVNVGVLSLLFSSPDSLSATSAPTVSVGSGQGSGPLAATVTSGAYAHSFNFTVVHPGVPNLQVDDDLLQALPGTCGGFQRTRLRATSGGADITRLLTLSSTDTSVLTIDSSIPGRVMIVGVGVGTASVYVNGVSYTSVSVTVSAATVGLTRLDAGIVTGVQWASTPSLVSQFLASASHDFTSEASVGWLYVIATFDDGAPQPLRNVASRSLSHVLPSCKLRYHIVGRIWCDCEHPTAFQSKRRGNLPRCPATEGERSGRCIRWLRGRRCSDVRGGHDRTRQPHFTFCHRRDHHS